MPAMPSTLARYCTLGFRRETSRRESIDRWRPGDGLDVRTSIEMID